MEVTQKRLEYLKDDLAFKDKLRKRYYLAQKHKQFEAVDSVYRGMLRVIDILNLQDEIGV